MKKVFIILTAVLLAALLVSGFTHTVSRKEYVVVTRFGKPIATIVEPGLYFKLPPPADRVNRFDKRNQLHQGELMETMTRDRKNIVIRCAVLWKISKDDLITFYESVGNFEDAGAKLNDLLKSKRDGAVGDFAFDDLFSVEKPVKIPELEKRIKEELAASLSEGGYGMEIMTVEVDRLALPEANAFSVYQRMKKERMAEANLYRAEGEREAAKIRAEADRKSSEIRSNAYQEAQKIMGEGEAEAAGIYADAFSRDPDFYRFWRTMQSYEKILDQKTTLVLSEDSELLKYLQE